MSANRPAVPASAKPDAQTTLLARLEQQQLGREYAHLSTKVRKRPLVLFFGRNTFSDNSKYLYLQACAAQRGYEVLWCTFHDGLFQQLIAEQLPCVHLGQQADRTIDLLLHAAVVIYTVNPSESLNHSQAYLGCVAGATQVQLWHGISVKQLTLQLIPHLGTRSLDLRQPWCASSAVNHVLSTASCFDTYWRDVFGCRSLIRSGYPRNEVILRQALTLEMLGAELPAEATAALQGNRPALLVVPTWQRGQATALSEARFLEQALHFADQHDCNLFFKAHPAYFGRMKMGPSTGGRLHLLDPGLDIYPWLFRFNALITDYSSIMFDFLHTGQPVLTLDLQPGHHQNFEPDYRLVPEGRWRHLFNLDDLQQRWLDALDHDACREDRHTYVGQLFESDPLLANAQLLRAIDDMVARQLQPDHSVWVPT